MTEVLEFLNCSIRSKSNYHRSILSIIFKKNPPVKFSILSEAFFFWDTKFKHFEFWRNNDDRSFSTLELFYSESNCHRSILPMKTFKKSFFCVSIPRIHFRIEFSMARKFLLRDFFFFKIQNSTISNSGDRSSWTHCSVRTKSNCLRRVIPSRRGGGRIDMKQPKWNFLRECA